MMNDSTSDIPDPDHEPIIVTDYNSAWPTMYEQEKARILEAIGEHVEHIEHIGSTSIPNMASKPIIDIAVSVPDLSHVEACIGPLRQLGYQYLGEYGIPERHFFRKPADDAWSHRTHQIHLVKTGSIVWNRHMLFRDYLRLHLIDAQEYEALKRDLAVKYRDDRDAYTGGKSDFIEAIIVKAALHD